LTTLFYNAQDANRISLIINRGLSPTTQPATAVLITRTYPEVHIVLPTVLAIPRSLQRIVYGCTIAGQYTGQQLFVGNLLRSQDTKQNFTALVQYNALVRQSQFPGANISGLQC